MEIVDIDEPRGFRRYRYLEHHRDQRHGHLCLLCHNQTSAGMALSIEPHRVDSYGMVKTQIFTPSPVI